MHSSKSTPDSSSVGTITVTSRAENRGFANIVVLLKERKLIIFTISLTYRKANKPMKTLQALEYCEELDARIQSTFTTRAQKTVPRYNGKEAVINQTKGRCLLILRAKYSRETSIPMYNRGEGRAT
jgi:hypothetical protein